MSPSSATVVLCNGASLEALEASENLKSVIRLGYQSSEDFERNVNLSLPDFVRDVYYLRDRVLDLLELAAYVYAADRSVGRGAKNAVEFSGWARPFHFVIKVDSLVTRPV